MRLNPYHPERFWSHLARACFAARRYGEAVEALKCISSPDALVRAPAWPRATPSSAPPRPPRRSAWRRSRWRRRSRSPECLATLHYRDPAFREHHRLSLERAGFPA